MPKILPSVKKTILTKSFVSISKAAEFLKVSPDTLRNWEREGKLLPSRTYGGARRYNRAELLELKKEIHPFAVRRKGLVNISQAAKALRVSPDTIRNWDKKGLIETERSRGGARRFTRDEIERLQKELGIETKVQISTTLPKFSQETSNFTPAWFKITFSMALVILILATGWFVKSFIDPLQKKIDETSKLIAGTVLSIESLQKGVLGIQSQPTPSPIVLPSSFNTPSANSKTTIVFGSAEVPININSSNGQISCPGCLTVSSIYISSVVNSDGALGVSTSDRQATVSLNLGHTNTWESLQNFSHGLYASSEGGGQNYAAIFKSGNVGIGWTSPANKLEVAGAQVIGQGYTGAYTAPDNGLLVQGNVGIGVSTPLYHLDVAGGARFGCGNRDWDSGPTTGCSDIAEVYQSDGSVNVGDIVVTGQEPNIVTRSTTPYQKNIIGVYSTSPALLIGGQTILGGGSNLGGNKIPVALTGRVPVKVSDENGPIQVGDFLTSSKVPGVAMKATKAGSVLGQALEPFDISASEAAFPDSGDTHLVDIRFKFKVILAFVNVSFADPSNFLTSLSLDDQGNLIAPKIKTASISLDLSVASVSAQQLTSGGSKLASNDFSGEITSLEDRIKSLESTVEKLTENVPVETNGNVGIGTTSPNDNIKTSLTPPDVLFATASAMLANLKVTDSLSSDKLFAGLDIKASGNLNVFGKTTLAATTIAGDLSIDGTLSINGNSINVIGSPVCSETNKDCGILYLQNSPLSFGVNFFNGLVTIDKLGNLRAQTVTVAEFRVVGSKISGSGKISEGSKSVDLENPLVKSSSRILITPTSETNLVLAVTDKTEGKSFTVLTAQPAVKDVLFDWFIINESSD